MYGCSGQHHSRAFSWLSHVTLFTQRREPISPVSVGRVTMNQSLTCGLQKCVYCHLPELQRSEAQSGRKRASEESGKESCVIELAIEGSIEGGSITQHPSTPRKIDSIFTMEIQCVQHNLTTVNIKLPTMIKYICG